MEIHSQALLAPTYTRSLPVPGSLGPLGRSLDSVDLSAAGARPIPRPSAPAPVVPTQELVAAVANAAAQAAALGFLSVPTGLPMPPSIPHYPGSYYPYGW
jgi:hypothetical protein